MRNLILPALFCITACSPGPVRIAPPPAELQTCADEPAKPDLAPYDWTGIEAAAQTVREAVDMTKGMVTARDRVEFEAYLAMRSAWGDCKATVSAVRAWARTVE